MKVSIAVDLALALLENGARVSALAREARADGKDEIDDARLEQVFVGDDVALANFRQAIAVAKRESR